jgi:CheY-like chemotaxis protein
MTTTVLIADDDPIQCELLRETIDTGLFRIIECRDGVEALRAVRECHPALAFLDGSLPGLSGIDICRLLRADPATASLAVVLLTLPSHLADRRSAAQAGFDSYIAKPFSPRLVLDAVRDVLGSDALVAR